MVRQAGAQQHAAGCCAEYEEECDGADQEWSHALHPHFGVGGRAVPVSTHGAKLVGKPKAR